MDKKNTQSTFEPKFEPDSLAITESQAWSSHDDLDKSAAVADHHRFQKFKSSVNHIAIILLFLFAFLFVCGVLTIAWHMLAPETCFQMDCHYLSAAQLDRLHTIVGSALFSSIATNYIKNRVQ